MFVVNFLKSLGLGRNTAGRRVAARASRRLGIETLEDRTVPTTFNVGGGQNPSATIQAALAAAHNGDTIQIYSGTYSVSNASGPLNITQSNLTLTAIGSGSDPVIQATSTGSETFTTMINVTGTNDKINDFTIDGGGDKSQTIDSAIRVTGSATIENSTIQDLYNQAIPDSIGNRVGTAIRVGDSATGQTGVAKILYNDIQTYYKAGIIVDNAGSAATITGNIITGEGATPSGVNVATEQYGIAVVNGGAARITNNTITNNTSAGAIRAAGVIVNNNTINGHNYQTVINNNSFNNDQDGVILQNSNGGVQVLNNNVDNGSADGILLLEANHETINDNCVYGNGTNRPAGSGGGGGITLFGSSYNNINNNDVENSTYDGIYIDNTTGGGGYNWVQDNDLVNNGVNASIYGGGNGIWLFNSNGDSLIDNGMVGNSLNGILIQNGNNNLVFEGSSIVNVGDGVQVLNSNKTTIEWSVIAANGGYGVNVLGSNNTTIDFNLIADNDAGAINIGSANGTASTNTNVYGNIIINNTYGSLRDVRGAANCSNDVINSCSDADAACANLC
jgi:parallel beta-helix repeat protein